MIIEEQKPFHERYEFAGHLVSDSRRSGEMQFVIDFTLLNGGSIEGWIIGNNLTAAECDSFMGSKAGPCQIESVDGGGQRIAADRVLITNVTRRIGGLHSEGGPHGAVAEFICREVTEDEEFPPHAVADDTKRTVTFLFDGPGGVWIAPEIGGVSWTGERTVEARHTNLDIGLSWPAKVDARNHYFWHSKSTGERAGAYSSVPALSMDVDDALDVLSDHALLERATNLADDLSVLMSFAQRRRTHWYHSTFIRKSGRLKRRRHGLATSREKRRIDDSPVGTDIRQFLKVCLPKFVELRASGTDLRLPLMYATPNGESRFVEERFASYFWALEKLVDLLARQAKRDKIFNSTTFDRISDAVRQAVPRLSIAESRWGSAENGLALLCQKLPDLNRPAFGTMLSWLCQQTGVEWVDLYPAGDYLSPPFIAMRNRIFHAHGEIDGARVLREAYRVRAVFERVVLRLLGWSDLNYTRPREFAQAIETEL